MPDVAGGTHAAARIATTRPATSTSSRRRAGRCNMPLGIDAPRGVLETKRCSLFPACPGTSSSGQGLGEEPAPLRPVEAISAELECALLRTLQQGDVVERIEG